MTTERFVVEVDADLEELIPGFLNNRQADLEKIRMAIADADFNSIQSIAHSIKGVGGGYGFDRLSEIGFELENNAKLKNATELSALSNAMEEYLNKLEIVYVE